MRLSSVPDWVYKRMNQGTEHKIKNTKASYALVMDGDYQIKQIYEDKENKGRYIYTVLCENSKTEKMLEFFKWMIYISKNNKEIMLKFLYDSNLSYRNNEEYEMVLISCKKESDTSFSLSLFTDNSLNGRGTNKKVSHEKKKEKTTTGNCEKDLEEICENLKTIVKEQKAVIEELMQLKTEVETIKSTMTSMIPEEKSNK